MHTTLYGHLGGLDLPTFTTKRWTDKVEETYTYRYLNGVPLTDGHDALLVNWCELSIMRSDGKVTDKNAFATNHVITSDTIAEIVLADLRALTRYLYFESWDYLLTFMIDGLELSLLLNTT